MFRTEIADRAVCLVVGGNGFIGSHLVDALAALGHQVRVFDRFSAGVARYDAPNVLPIAGDFLNAGQLGEAVKGADYVFHFLSTTTPASAEQDPLVDIRTNVTSSVELLRQCAVQGVRHVFYASTGGAIYGSTGPGRVDEAAVPRPVSPYAIGKLTVEGYLRYFRATHGLSSTSFRISNPYGPRQQSTHTQGVIPIFLRAVSRGEPITVYGDGSMVRDYIYVEDLAALVARASLAPPSRDLYNLGSGLGYSVSQLIEVISAVTGITPRIRFVDKPVTFVDKIVLDPTRFEKELGISSAFTSLENGIKKTWAEVCAS